MLKYLMTFAIIVPILAQTNNGCDDQPTKLNTQKTEERQTENNQAKLVAADPPHLYEQSLERKNLNARLDRLNKQNAIGYVYLMSDYGQVITELVIKGKVSSLNSLLTTPQQIVARSFGTGTEPGNPHTEGFVVDSPDLDGSYGKNPEGVFGFTTDGTYWEWTGKYFFSDRPYKISTQPVLTSNVDLEKHGK